MQSSTSSTRFWAKVRKARSTAACWDWKAATLPSGYGVFWQAGRLNYAHRVSYELANGPIPAGHVVRHACDRPSCVNPAHLEVGSTQDNVNDAIARGRHVQGERVASHKLTAADVQRIRNAYDHGSLTQRDLAELYGVSPRAISDICSGRTWKHLPAPAAGSPE